MTATQQHHATLRFAYETGLVVEVEIDAGFATGTVCSLTSEEVSLSFGDGLKPMSIALADVFSAHVLGRQLSS